MVIDAAQARYQQIANDIRVLTHDVDRIFYCHRFGSYYDSSKDKVRALRSAAMVDGNTVDYTRPPHKVFASFAKAMSPRKKHLIVGTSMGGFFAAWLGSELGLPFVAINPAIQPAVSLRKHIGEGQAPYGTQFFLKEDTVDAYRGLPFRVDGSGFIAIDLGDKVIDPQETLRAVGGSLPIVTFPGGSHRFDHMGKLSIVIKSVFFKR